MSSTKFNQHCLDIMQSAVVAPTATIILSLKSAKDSWELADKCVKTSIKFTELK